MPDLKKLESYSYTFDRDVLGIPKGTVLKLRRMGEEKRDEFLKLRMPGLALQVRTFWDHLIGQEIDPDEWERLRKQFIKTVKHLILEENKDEWLILVSNALPATHAQILERIILVEASLSVGDGIPEEIKLPDPIEVDAMDPKAVEDTTQKAQQLGGDSPAALPHTTTGPSPQPEEESKSGQESKASGN